MEETISGETLFEEFVEQIVWNQEAVAVQNQYTPAHIVSMTYTTIEKCRLYQYYCQQWSQKPRLEETWSNFKAQFSRAFKETQRSLSKLKTKRSTAYIQAAQANALLFTNMHQDHTLELASIATLTQANRTSGEMLMKTILELSSQFATLTAKIATAKSKNARLEKSGHCSALANHGHQASRKPNPSYQNVYSNSGQNFDPNGYCSLNGYKV